MGKAGLIVTFISNQDDHDILDEIQRDLNIQSIEMGDDMDVFTI